MRSAYAWKRFWCPRGQMMSADFNGSFLLDPESTIGAHTNAHLVATEQLGGLDCLVLLGDPGSGKSSELALMVEVERAKLAVPGELLHSLDLSVIGSDAGFQLTLSRDPILTEWQAGGDRLTLALDSLDEAQVRVDNIGRVLACWLTTIPRERLRLRIACRGAEWPASLEGQLRGWWPEGVRVLELAPLRASDVRDAATQEGLDADAFMGALLTASAHPLAAHPVTLRFLIDIWRKEGAFPTTRFELYERGCLLLAEDRIGSASRPRGIWSASQLLEVSGRVAACTLLCGKAGISTGVETGATVPDTVAVSSLAGGVEEVQGTAFDVSEAAIRAALQTALFSIRDEVSVGWAHKSYGEFLAARYLATRLESAQAKSFLLHPDEPTRVVPQLRTVAAWCAAKSPDLFDSIVQGDPLVLLRGDSQGLRNEQRASLVERLLAKVASTEGDDRDWGLRATYPALAHPALADRLRPYIVGRSNNVIVRRMAIDIAEACGCATLLDELIAVALDTTDETHIREQAATAVQVIGDVAARQRLRPLLEDSAASYGGLRGSALLALWPTHLPSTDVFALLTTEPTTSISIGGSYWTFLAKFGEALRIEDLAVALAWVERQGAVDDEIGRYGDLIRAVLRKAWEHFEEPGVLPAFASAVRSRLKRYEAILGGSAEGESPDPLDGRRRRLLVEGLIETTPELTQEASRLIHGRPALVFQDDIPWLVDRCSLAIDSQPRWLRLIVLLFKQSEDPDHLDAVLRASETNEALRTALGCWVTGIAVESHEAASLRQEERDHRQLLESMARTPTKPATQRSERERLVALVDAGDDERLVWQYVANLLRLGDRPAPFGGDLLVPVWMEVDADTRSKVVDLARRFLLAHCTPPKAGEEGSREADAWAISAALRVVAIQDLTWLTSRPDHDWEAWTPALVDHFSEGERRPDRGLLQEAWQRTPSTVGATLTRAIETAEPVGLSDPYIAAIRTCWSPALEGLLMDVLERVTLPPRVDARLTDTMLARGSSRAHQRAVVGVRTQKPSVRHAIELGRTLLDHVDSESWMETVSAVQADRLRGRVMVRRFARYVDHGTLGGLERLKPQQLAQFYLMTHRRRVSSVDQGGRLRHTRSWLWSVNQLRSRIVERLVDLGTPEAVAALVTMRDARPDLGALPFMVHTARTRMFERMWQAPSVGAFMSVARDRRARLVESGEQLLAVVLEALADFERCLLRGPTPAVRFLWDRQAHQQKGKPTRAQERYRPIDENELSDLVKLHLERFLVDRGIVVNREVEIKRGYGANKGQRTDILVQATIRPSSREVARQGTVAVVIETKGCWNDELDTALDVQLRDQYLLEHGAKHGVYLIGWFPCSAWDPVDPRRTTVPAGDLAAMRARFSHQAAKASVDGVRISAVILDARLG